MGAAEVRRPSHLIPDYRSDLKWERNEADPGEAPSNALIGVSAGGRVKEESLGSEFVAAVRT
jgi:hypothetical protein